MQQTKLKFNRGKKKYCFDLVNNLDEFNLDIVAALVCWSARTKSFTIDSFIKYIKSKGPDDIFIVTQKEFDLISTKK